MSASSRAWRCSRLALLWLIALVSYTPSRSGLVLQRRAGGRRPQLRRPRRRVPGEASFQLLGYTAFLMPVVLGVVGWHYFWCTASRRGYTKLAGAVLLFALRCRACWRWPSARFDRRAAVRAPAACWAGASPRRCCRCTSIAPARPSAADAHGAGGHPVDAVLVRPGGSRAVGRAAAARSAAVLGRWRDWREQRRRDKERAADRREARQEGRPRAGAGNRDQGRRRGRHAASAARPSPMADDDEDDDEDATAARPAPARAARDPARRADAPVAQPLPLGRCREPQDARPSAARAATCCRRSRCSTRPRTSSKIDERELMEAARLLEEKCREFSVEGTVVQIHPGPGGHDLRVQAGRRREVQPHHGPGRRPVPRDAGRVGPDRSHPRQVDGRHPDSEPAPRGHHAARTARVRRLHAVRLASSPWRWARPSTASRSSAIWRRCRTC